MTKAFDLSLHHITAIDVSPAQLIGLAGANGCSNVCLFTYVPEAVRKLFPMIEAKHVAELNAVSAGVGVGLCNLEVFPLDGNEDFDAFRRALEVGKSLGAKRATAHVHQTEDMAVATDRFASFCALAAEFDIIAGLEFHAFSSVQHIGAAANIVRDAGSDHGQLVCDTLHLIRTGGSVGDVIAHADIIGYAQMSDGPMTLERDKWWKEAVGTRGYPGTGELPLQAIAKALRQDTVIEVEVPRKADIVAGVDASDRVARAVEATRSVLNA